MNLQDQIQQLITDLDTARTDGHIYTYGQVQERLREMLSTPAAAAHVSATEWRGRWEKLHERLEETRAENAQLREAFDDLNTDTENLFSDANQSGVEAAKSHAIKSLMASNRRLKQQTSEGSDEMFPGTMDALSRLGAAR
jgi:predicted nuclease with TOPRIM domain